jgi:glycine/serine hydroxymethyltransferase
LNMDDESKLKEIKSKVNDLCSKYPVYNL